MKNGCRKTGIIFCACKYTLFILRAQAILPFLTQCGGPTWRNRQLNKANANKKTRDSSALSQPRRSKETEKEKATFRSRKVAFFVGVPGLEPGKTGPESVVLPITPYPNLFRLRRDALPTGCRNVYLVFASAKLLRSAVASKPFSAFSRKNCPVGHFLQSRVKKTTAERSISTYS